MFKIQLINDQNCVLETYEAKDSYDAAEKIGEWVSTISDGDTIKFMSVGDDE